MHFFVEHVDDILLMMIQYIYTTCYIYIYFSVEHVDDILLMMFQYIEMLRREGPQEWVYKECQQLSDMIFRFKDKEKPINYTSFLARRMQVTILYSDGWKSYSAWNLCILKFLLPTSIIWFPGLHLI